MIKQKTLKFLQWHCWSTIEVLLQPILDFKVKITEDVKTDSTEVNIRVCSSGRVCRDSMYREAVQHTHMPKACTHYA